MGSSDRSSHPSLHFPHGLHRVPRPLCAAGIGAKRPWPFCSGQQGLTGTSNKAGSRALNGGPPTHPWDPGAFGSCHHLGQPEAFILVFIHSFIHCSFTNIPEASLHLHLGPGNLGSPWWVGRSSRNSEDPDPHQSPHPAKGFGGPEEHLRVALPMELGAQVVQDYSSL